MAMWVAAPVRHGRAAWEHATTCASRPESGHGCAQAMADVEHTVAGLTARVDQSHAVCTRRLERVHTQLAELEQQVDRANQQRRELDRTLAQNRDLRERVTQASVALRTLLARPTVPHEAVDRLRAYLEGHTRSL